MVLLSADQLEYLNEHHKTPNQSKVYSQDMVPHSEALQWASEIKFFNIPAYSSDEDLVRSFIGDGYYTQTDLTYLVMRAFRDFQLGLKETARQNRRYAAPDWYA